ncbi:ATP-binding cassette domain-containing protein [Virgibacillus sp. LDC-1]|uniref:ATP-binding cassette domain-containing protein n=1 Tax=Virgibacillus sp. LDC-1 TaxID=3039856 RepID=UPI0024DE394E|nr:ATP-binding cassette domain-containing protein [Virgibacillus sp. LDC-1]
MVSNDNTFIRLDHVDKAFDNRNVLKRINLSINEGEFIAIVGKSGCGKSTLLRIIAGLETYDSGNVSVREQPLRSFNKKARIMFQDGRLLPWKTVIENVAIGLGKGKEEKALEALDSVGLAERMKDWPNKLSGGQQQRVALARALVHDPKLLLLDEPLGALDALTRIEMQELIERLWRKNKFTAVLVTHDVEEAVAIADRVLLIEDGTIKLNQEINLPRPRLRTQQAFGMYTEMILNRILGRKPLPNPLQSQAVN